MTTQTKNRKDIGRLKKRSDFLRVQKESQANNKKWVSKTVIVQVAKGESGVRYGLTVSKKVDKRAVNRNRIKRRLRAVLDDVLQAYVEADLDIVVIGRGLTLTAPIDDIKRDLCWCLKRLDIQPFNRKEASCDT